MLFLLATLCPPLAVLLTGSPRRAAANTGLTLLLFAPGMIHAITAVRRYYTDRRNDALLRAVSLQYA